VPWHLWRALQRFDVWIEPALVPEWSRPMKSYGETQGRRLGDSAIVKAMTWSEPGPDVRVAREQALRLIEGPGLRCVWTGRALSTANVDVDHCLPWVAVRESWNLLPAYRSVNQNQKRDRLPGDAILGSAQDRIQQWRDGRLRRAHVCGGLGLGAAASQPTAEPGSSRPPVGLKSRLASSRTRGVSCRRSGSLRISARRGGGRRGLSYFVLTFLVSALPAGGGARGSHAECPPECRRSVGTKRRPEARFSRRVVGGECVGMCSSLPVRGWQHHASVVLSRAQGGERVPIPLAVNHIC
jgi:hypothetical protein